MAPEVAGSTPVTHPTFPRSVAAGPRARGRAAGRLVLAAAAWIIATSGGAAAASREAAAPRGGGGAASGGVAAGNAAPAAQARPAGAADGAARTPAGTGGVNRPAAAARPYVVLVSFDGFRADYLDRFRTPRFDRLAARGVRADRFVSVFPTLTFPAHASIATGLHPADHGIVGNRFYDPVRGDTFDYRDRGDAQDGSWWRGEPIWVTAETQGLVAAAFFFPGTEAAIGGVRPSQWRPYDGGVANAARVDQVLAWLAQPPPARPHLVTLYFSLVDGAGHELGPGDPRMQRSVARADRLLGRLLDGVDALPHADRVAVVVVSDHGMAEPDPAALSELPATVDLAGVRISTLGPAVSLHVGDPDRSRRIRDALNAALPHARAWLRPDLPAPLRARGAPRFGDVLVIPHGAGLVRLPGAAPPPAGLHGWDPRRPAMHGLFIAAGPGIAAGVRLPEVTAVDVAPLIAHLLRLTPPPGIAGSLDPFAAGLQPAPAQP